MAAAPGAGEGIGEIIRRIAVVGAANPATRRVGERRHAFIGDQIAPLVGGIPAEAKAALPLLADGDATGGLIANMPVSAGEDKVPGWYNPSPQRQAKFGGRSG